MNIADRTNNLLDQLLYFDLNVYNTTGLDKARDIIRRALAEQDRDTRHACAGELQDISFVVGNVAVVKEDVACAAVMNCRGGVE